MRLDASFAHPSDVRSPGRATPDLRTRPVGPTERAESAVVAEFESQCAAVVLDSAVANRLPADTALVRVRTAAEAMAAHGISIAEAQRVVRVAVSARMEKGADAAAGVVDRAVFLMGVLEHLGNAVSAVYLDHCRRETGTTRRRVSRLVEMLATGDPDARIEAERHGVDVAAEYDVVILQMHGPSASRDRTAARPFDGSVDVDAVLAEVGPDILTSFTGNTGTLLIPSVDSTVVDRCIERLNRMVDADVVAATSNAVVGDIASAAAHCRELVGLARALGMGAGLYRTADLAFEYQLSRPGPGQARLRSLIAPLESFPELVHTLRTFIESEANRRASAKSLFVHPNTVDYRLKRIEHLTGVDPLSSAGLMSLHAALVVDKLARRSSDGLDLAGEAAKAS